MNATSIMIGGIVSAIGLGLGTIRTCCAITRLVGLDDANDCSNHLGESSEGIGFKDRFVIIRWI